MAAERGGEIGTAEIDWSPTYRIIPSRFPPVQLFERVADPVDLDAVLEIEALTNERIRDEVGELNLVPPEDRVSGPGSSFIMAAFTHVYPSGGRFNDGRFGAYYTARDRPTAIAETVYHRERFLAYTDQPPSELAMRVLRARVKGKMHELRGQSAELPAVYDRDDYTGGQALARRLREAGSYGIVYDSVRREGGECAAVLRPPVLSGCKQAEHLGYMWDGSRITTVYEKRLLRR
ncbi:MAG TPA: RES family NAD+ phosphorylase [Longimicrobiaceae bacterium]|nr:RES family NAD+ phosphorylase [Longimicrobiaceae bacterium]